MSKQLYGYGGSIARVDLSSGSITSQPTSLGWLREVIGGRAAGSKRLLEELKADCDPLGPDNMLIFSVGPLTGTILPASAYFTVTAKSPMTGILGDSAAGGHFAAQLKACGIDQLIITGKAPILSYLHIDSQGVRLLPCPELRGQTINQTTKALRQRQRNYRLEVAAIGLAGENKVKFAAIVSSGNRVNGRCGMGAVMGSKNLKAITLSGFKPIMIHSPLDLWQEAKGLEHEILGHSEYRKRYRLGTTMLMDDLNSIGILPTKHFQEGVCDYLAEISGETLATQYKTKNKGCFNCNLHCSRFYKTPTARAEGPEFETLCGFTSRIGSNDLAFALEMNEYLNQNGIDSISSSEVVGWLMECQEKGLLTAADLDGLQIAWGDTAAIRQVIELINTRKGIGDALAEGATVFSKRFSAEAQKLVMQVKGLDLICGDPRGIKAYGLTYAIASRGGDHLRAEPYFEMTERWDVAQERFGTPKAADRLAEEGKAALVTYSEKIALLTDCLTMCKNIGLCMDILDMETSARILKYATGVDYSPGDLLRHLGDAVNRDRELNLRFGLKGGLDTLPERFITEPLKRGPSAGSMVDIGRMVSEYYTLHEWKE